MIFQVVSFLRLLGQGDNFQVFYKLDWKPKSMVHVLKALLRLSYHITSFKEKDHKFRYSLLASKLRNSLGLPCPVSVLVSLTGRGVETQALDSSDEDSLIPTIA